MVLNLFITGQPLFGGGTVNLDKNIIKVENIAPKNKFNSNNLNEEINLIKNKLFIYLLVN